MKALYLILITAALFIGQQVTLNANEKSDIFLVLDNSGSMKINDPKFLTPEVVSNFLKGIGEQSRLGMVIFDRTAVLAQPLTSITEDSSREKFLKSLEKVNYKGQWTNIPAAIERALYELKTNGRKDAEKIIIFLTDGIVDTGNKEQDIEKLSWLKEELAQDSKNSGVRIFGIAFTEKADFSLIQTLALKTDGQYFRAFKAEDIQGVFTKISQAIKTLKAREQLKPKETPAASPPSTQIKEPVSPAAPAKKEGPALPLPVILGVGFVLLLMVILLLTRKKTGSTPAARVSTAVDIPPAKLIDQQQVVSSEPIEINKPTITIGRDPNTDITIPKETVSALHATIKYEDHGFYLEDQRSSNFTRLNNEKIVPNKPVFLKSGDRITFDIYNFQFITQMAPAGGTVLKRDSSEVAGRTDLREPEPSQPKTMPKPGPEVKKEAPERKTMPKPKPGIKDEPPPQKTIPKPEKKEKDEPPERKTIPKPKPGIKKEPTERETLLKPKKDKPQPPVPEEKTKLKSGMCPRHPLKKATDLCMICKKPFCSECISEIDGKDVCVDCAKKL